MSTRKEDSERLRFYAQLATVLWGTLLITVVVIAWIIGRLDVAGLAVILPTLAGIVVSGLGLARLVK